MGDARGWTEHDDVCDEGHMMVWASNRRLVCPVCVTRAADRMRDQIATLTAALEGFRLFDSSRGFFHDCPYGDCEKCTAARRALEEG